MNGERGCRLELSIYEYMERNGSAQNGFKTSCKRKAYPYLCGTAPYITAPKFPCIRSLMYIPLNIFRETSETVELNFQIQNTMQ